MLSLVLSLALATPELAPHPSELQALDAPAPAPMTMFDGARQRTIPVQIYGRPSDRSSKPLAIISHGYGGHNNEYQFIAEYLVARGYLVAAIEHLELPGDPPMVNSGDLAVLRRPVWQVGAKNIGFVMGELIKRKIALAVPKPIIIGHSNGGDMTMLFATTHPRAVRAAISLDNRRMPLPRVSEPEICSIRSSDYEADAGVLPSSEEQASLGMTIIRVPVKHDDMWDGATPADKASILSALSKCLDQPASHRSELTSAKGR